MITVPDFILDALKDSINLITPLFLVFVGIEIFEVYFSKNILKFHNFSYKLGPLLGSLFAIIPQCGFSVIATVLYVKRFISMGTLIAIYIATSDEAIPILISYPDMLIPMLKIVSIKLIIAILFGYLCDLIFKPELKIEDEEEEIQEEGCCHHGLGKISKRKLFLHPVKHTFNIFCFIFITCTALNFVLMKFGIENTESFMLQGSILQPVLTAFIGVIPNCAISVLITMLYIKGIIGMSSAVAGLSAGGGLGILVLFKKNQDIKNSFLILGILIGISACAGCALKIFGL